MFCKPFFFFTPAGCSVPEKEKQNKGEDAEVFASFVRKQTRGDGETFFIRKLSVFYLKRHESEPQLYFVGLKFRFGGVWCLFSTARESSCKD